MAYAYIIERGQLNSNTNRFELHVDDVFTSQEKANFMVEQELRLNKAYDIERETYEINRAELQQVTYLSSANDRGVEVKLRTIIRKIKMQ